MIALRQGNENPQNNMTASFSFASTGKCNSMFKSVGSLFRMEAFLPKTKKIAAEGTEKKKKIAMKKDLIDLDLPPFSLIRDFGKQNTRGNVSKISVSLACYREIGSKSTNYSH